MTEWKKTVAVLERVRRVKWRKWLLSISAVIIAAEGVSLVAIIHRRERAERYLAREIHLAIRDTKTAASKREVRSEQKLPSRSTFAGFLENQGFEADLVSQLIADAHSVYDLARVRAGHKVTLVTSPTGSLKEVDYQIDRAHVLGIKKKPDGFVANVKDLPVTTCVAGVSGTVHDSLFNAVENAGEQDTLAIKIADIFAWDFDFNTDTQDGDHFEVLVEKKTINGKFSGYGQVLAAEYDSGGHPYQAVLFQDAEGQSGYYTPDGKALKKEFLRSPLRFAAPITSRFSYHRFHPILKRYRPHLGIDYGAPTGSKVQAVANGVVEVAGWHGGSGKEVRLRHARGYETYYLHLSRILVHRGERVHQGQVIALSGSTGLATGPHLDFRITQHGKFLNFLSLKLPPAQAVPHSEWKQFAKIRGSVLGQLAGLRLNRSGTEQAALNTPAQSVAHHP